MSSLAYAEIIEIMDNLSENDRNKIPKNVYNFFLENQDKNYVKHLRKDIRLSEQELREDTKGILALILDNYLYRSEDERKRLARRYFENEIKYQQELKEKYNPENIFENKKVKQYTNEENSMQMIKYTEKSIFSKIIDKIKAFLKFG